MSKNSNIAYINSINKASNWIKKRIAREVRKAVILGTGLGGFTEMLDEIVLEIPYAEIPEMPESTVEGHAGKLILARHNGEFIAVLSGRFHYYEGYDMRELTLPIRVLKILGVEELYITNVSGSVNENFGEGELVMLRDHINMMPENPLRGANFDVFGPRFPDFSEVYSKRLRSLANAAADSLGIGLNEGVYYALQGPNLETPAEYKMIHLMGADLVGMSTVPEVIVARHMDIEVLVLSMVSNLCYPPEKIKETTIESVIRLAQERAPDLSRLLIKILNHDK